MVYWVERPEFEGDGAMKHSVPDEEYTDEFDAEEYGDD